MKHKEKEMLFIKKRNNMMNNVLAVLCILDLLLNVWIHIFVEKTTTLVITILLVTVFYIVFSRLLYHIDKQKILTYFNATCLALVIFAVGLLDNHLSTTLYLLLAVVVVTLLNDVKIILYASFLTSVGLVYAHFFQPDIWPENWAEFDFVYMLFLVVTITIVLAVNVIFYNRLQAVADKEKDEVEHVSKKNEEVVDAVQRALVEANRFNQSLNGRVKDMKESAATTTQTVDQIKQAMTIQNETITQLTQKNMVYEALLNEVDHSVANSEKMTKEMNQSTEEARLVFSQMQETMLALVETMRESSANIENLLKRSSEIYIINETISEIAQKTNLLALNAAIEAARAGEHGKGFSVVAEEIKKLANQSSENAKTVATILENITEITEKTGQSSFESQHKLMQTHEQTDRLASVFDTVSEKGELVREQTKTVSKNTVQLRDLQKELLDGMTNVAAISEENESGVHEILNQVMNIQNYADGTREGFLKLDKLMRQLETETKK